MRRLTRRSSIPFTLALGVAGLLIPCAAAQSAAKPETAPATTAQPPAPPAAAPAPAAAADALNDPEIQKQLQGKTPEEAKAWGALMSAKGLKRLPYDELVAWNAIRTKLAGASPAVCAGYWKGGIAGEEVQKALATLPKEDVDRWTSISTHAMVLEAKDTAYPATTQNDFIEFMKLAASELNEQDRTRFQTLVGKGAAITDEEACWLMTTLLQKAANNGADQAAKERFLRAFAGLSSPKS